jgi:hypothetical protein
MDKNTGKRAVATDAKDAGGNGFIMQAQLSGNVKISSTSTMLGTATKLVRNLDVIVKFFSPLPGDDRRNPENQKWQQFNKITHEMRQGLRVRVAILENMEYGHILTGVLFVGFITDARVPGWTGTVPVIVFEKARGPLFPPGAHSLQALGSSAVGHPAYLRDKGVRRIVRIGRLLYSFKLAMFDFHQGNLLSMPAESTKNNPFRTTTTTSNGSSVTLTDYESLHSKYEIDAVRMGFIVTRDCSPQMHIEAACHLGMDANGTTTTRIPPSWMTESGDITVDGTWNCGVLILSLLMDGLVGDTDVKRYGYIDGMVRNNADSVRVYAKFLQSLQAAARGPPLNADADLFSGGMWHLSGADMHRAHAPAFALMASGATQDEMRRGVRELIPPGDGLEAALLAIDVYFRETAELLDPYGTQAGWLEWVDGTFPPLFGFTKILREAAVASGALAFLQGAFAPNRPMRRAHFETNLAFPHLPRRTDATVRPS